VHTFTSMVMVVASNPKTALPYVFTSILIDNLVVI
jgi:hypothetical protein